VSVSAARAERVRWADTAKGVCILLVVLWHVVAKQYLRLDWPEGLRVPGAWGTLGELLLPLRMPLFFTISGMFALGAVHRPWRVSARSRVAKFLYLYVLWLLIHTTLLSLAPDFPTDRATSPAELLEQLTITPSNLWYLFALALYFVIAKATWRLPRVVVLVPALALSIAASAELIPVPGNRAGLLQNLVFFLLGLYFRPYVERLAERANWPRLALFTGVYGGLLGVMFVTGTQDVPGVWPVVCVAAAAFGVVGAAMLARWDRVAEPLISIGRRTLPIYVIHMPLLALLDVLLAGPLAAVEGPLQVVLAVVEPILMTALISWICLLMHRGLEASKLSRFLLDLPGGGKPKQGTGPRSGEGAGPAPASTASPGHAAEPVGVGAHHAASPAETYATVAHAAGGAGGLPGAPWPTGHDAAGGYPQQPVHPGPGYPDPSPAAHQAYQAYQQGSLADHVRQDPFANLGHAQPAGPANHPVNSGFHQPGAPAAQPYPDYPQPAPPAHQGTFHQPDGAAAQFYPGHRQPVTPAASQGAPYNPDITVTQPHSAYRDPSHPAAPSADGPGPARPAWPSSPGHQESPYQSSPQSPAQPSPYQPSGTSRPASWFDPPQAAQGTSWAAGTAASGDDRGPAAAGQARPDPSMTTDSWIWSPGTEATWPNRTDRAPHDPRS
jgi:Predicted membrane protein